MSVVGVPDERFGQRVAAVVATTTQARASVGVAGRGRPHRALPATKVPRSVVRRRDQALTAGKPDYRWAASVAESRPADEAL